MNGYDLTREWYEYASENPNTIRPTHSHMYFYLIYLWNKLRQKDNFGLPTQFTMEALDIKSYKTYKNTLDDLVSWGFVDIVVDSKNQHQSKRIALVKNTKATLENEDVALVNNTKADTKATQSAMVKNTKAVTTIDKQYKYNTKSNKNSKNIPDENSSGEEIPVPSEHKKRKPSKPKTSTAKYPGLYQKIVSIFFDEIHPDFIFSAPDGKKVNSIIDKTMALFKKKGRAQDFDSVAEFFRHLCQSLPTYYADKQLRIIDSDFNTIIEQIKNQHNGQTRTSTRQSTFEQSATAFD